MTESDFADIAERKTIAVVELLGRLNVRPIKILVVGCGNGLEAGVLARGLGAETIGVDLGGQFAFEHDKARPATLLQMDAMALQFPDASFDLVYCFHALEHVPDPATALAEMSRVLTADGWYFVGTPNKSRLIGSLGYGAPMSSKIAWNINDWSMRLRGKWDNRYGAHAGFAHRELVELCRRAFGSAQDVSDDYYRLLYPRHGRKLAAIERLGLRAALMPCVYVFGGKRP